MNENWCFTEETRGRVFLILTHKNSQAANNFRREFQFCNFVHPSVLWPSLSLSLSHSLTFSYCLSHSLSHTHTHTRTHTQTLEALTCSFLNELSMLRLPLHHQHKRRQQLHQQKQQQRSRLNREVSEGLWVSKSEKIASTLFQQSPVLR